MACMIVVVSWIVLNTLLNIFVTERSSSYQSTAHARWPRANLEEPAKFLVAVLCNGLRGMLRSL